MKLSTQSQPRRASVRTTLLLSLGSSLLVGWIAYPIGLRNAAKAAPGETKANALIQNGRREERVALYEQLSPGPQAE